MMEKRSDGGPMNSPIYFAVAETKSPETEPYVVIRIDTSKQLSGGGVKAAVESLHWSREDAQALANRLNANL